MVNWCVIGSKIVNIGCEYGLLRLRMNRAYCQIKQLYRPLLSSPFSASPRSHVKDLLTISHLLFSLLCLCPRILRNRLRLILIGRLCLLCRLALSAEHSRIHAHHFR